MKQIFPSLQRFHIETIMYLIVIIVALVLLYLFINNKINLFEGFITTASTPTTTSTDVNCRDYSNVSGCEIIGEQQGRFNLIYYHDEECPYAQAFKTKVWDKIFISIEFSINNSFDNSMEGKLTQVIHPFLDDLKDTGNLFTGIRDEIKTERYGLDSLINAIVHPITIKKLVNKWIEKEEEDESLYDQYINRTNEIINNIIDVYITDNYDEMYCNTQDEKMKCQFPKKVDVYTNPTTTSVPSSEPTIEANTPLSSVEPNIKYYDRGYYKIHPFFERWFKDIFIIKKVGSEYEVEFIKRLSNVDDIINRFEMGWEDPDVINNYTFEQYNASIKAHIDLYINTHNYGTLMNGDTANENWGNKIGPEQDSIHLTDMINKYVKNIIQKKLGVKHTPAIIIEDTERATSEKSYKCNNQDKTLEDDSVFNYKLSDSYPPESTEVSRDSNYNLILLGKDNTEEGKQEAVPLEEIFYNNIIKFVDDRFQIFDDLGCHTQPSFNPEFYMYVYYGDNCETSHNCLNHIIEQYNDIILPWTDRKHSTDNFKILFIKVKTSEECNSNQILCMDDNSKNIEALDSTNNITFHLHNPNTSTTTTNSGSNTKSSIDHDVLNQFIQNYDKHNLKLPYIIMFLKYKDHKAIKSYKWINAEAFNDIHKKFHTNQGKNIHDKYAAVATTSVATTAAQPRSYNCEEYSTENYIVFNRESFLNSLSSTENRTVIFEAIGKFDPKINRFGQSDADDIHKVYILITVDVSVNDNTKTIEINFNFEKAVNDTTFNCTTFKKTFPVGQQFNQDKSKHHFRSDDSSDTQKHSLSIDNNSTPSIKFTTNIFTLSFEIEPPT